MPNEPTNEGQVEATPDGQVEETPQVEQTLQEQVSGLLKPTEPEPETEEVQPQEQQPTQEELIDDSLIEQYPVLKMYRGQKFKDALPKAYSEIVKKFTKTSEELSALKKQQLQSSIPKASEFPDPVEKPEEFQKALADYTEKIRQQALNEPRPEVPNIRAEIAKYLPEGTDVQSVVDGWSSYNAVRLFDETGQPRKDVSAFYDAHPDILIQEIARYHSLNSKANKSDAQIQSESKAKAAKDLTNAIRNANKNPENQPNAQANAVARDVALTAEDELLLKIRSKLG